MLTLLVLFGAALALVKLLPPRSYSHVDAKEKLPPGDLLRKLAIDSPIPLMAKFTPLVNVIL
jgi:hypothetical protein